MSGRFANHASIRYETAVRSSQRGDDGSALQIHWRAHEVALAELDPAMAQDVVGGGAVEIEVRQRVAEQQRLPRELAHGAAREGDLDLLVLAAVDLRRLEALDELDSLGD